MKLFRSIQNVQTIPTASLYQNRTGGINPDMNIIASSVKVFDVENDATDVFTFPNLATITGHLTLDNVGSQTAFSLPSLVTCSTPIVVQNCASLASFTCPGLAVLSGLMTIHANAALAAVSFPALNTLNATLAISNCPLPTGISLPALTNESGPNVQIANCSGLTNIAMNNAKYVPTVSGCPNLSTMLLSPSVIVYDNGSGASLSFFGCSLPSSMINFLLARCVATIIDVPDSNINLSGGTNGAPTGQGLIDKANLIAQGAAVSTN